MSRIVSKYLSKCFSRFARQERGTIAVAATLTVSAVAMAAGGAVDIARAVEARRVAQASVDAALLASAKPDFRTLKDREDFAREVFNEVTPLSVRLQIVDFDLDIDEEGILSLSVDTRVKTTLLKLAGFDALPVRASARAEVLPAESIELALALDSTGSMLGARLATLKTAATDLITTLEEGEDVKISVVPFSDYVNIGAENANLPGITVPLNVPQWIRVCGYTWISNRWVWNCGLQQRVINGTFNGCVGSPIGEADFRADLGGRQVQGMINRTCAKPLQRLTSNFDDARNKVNEMVANGLTYIPSGLIWAWRTLAPVAPFEDATDPENDPQIRKFLVLMTDGQNTVSVDTATGHHTVYDRWAADALTRQTCTAAKDEGIKIYTVAFEVNDTTTINLLKECASDPSTMFFDADNSEELVRSFEKIATDFRGVRLVN